MRNVSFHPCCIVCLVDLAHLERNKCGKAEVSQSQVNCHHSICWGSELLLHHGIMQVTSVSHEGAMRSIEPLAAVTPDERVLPHLGAILESCDLWDRVMKTGQKGIRQRIFQKRIY